MRATSLVSPLLILGQVTWAFNHPGILHTADDFDRVSAKVSDSAEPWQSGWEKLISNEHADPSWEPNPQAEVYRGTGSPENYSVLYRDIAAAYDLAIRWKVTDNTTFADAAVAILDAWSSTLKLIGGSADRFLAAGLYGYQFANAAEIMRDYSEWPEERFQQFVTMMVDIFYPMNHDFLTNHNDAEIDHYWANWDLCTMSSIISIGILSDNQTMYQEAVDYFKDGGGNGAIEQTVWELYYDVDGQTLGQLQESGRDQGHATLATGLLGAFAQTAYNQGDDLFEYLENRILAGSEYVAKYNVGLDVPYTTYHNSDDVNQTEISENARCTLRPVWELIYNHYAILKGLDSTYSKQMRDLVVEKDGGAEGGGGDYGPNSGGYDFLGHGTLMYTL